MTKNTHNITRIELAGYKQPSGDTFKDSSDTLKWGADNMYPQYLITLIKRSVKHAAIINGKVKYVVGSGIIVEGPVDVENNINKSDTWTEFDRKISYDYEMFNTFAIEVITSTVGGFGSINHIRVANIRKTKSGELLYCKDWSKRSEEKKPLKRYSHEDKSGVIVYCEYSIIETDYAIPNYLGAVTYAEIDASIATFRVNNIKNGFSAGTIVNFTNGVPTPDEQKKLEGKFKKKFTSEEEAGEIILTFSNGSERAPQVISVTPNNFDKLFDSLDDSCSENLFIGHSITSPLLMGVKTEGQLGGRTEIVEAHELFQMQYVDGRQKTIEDVINFVLSPYNTKIKIKPLNTIQEKLSENALMTILTKNELRKMAGYEEIAEAPAKVSEPQMSNAFKKLGSHDFKIVKEGFSVKDSQHAKYQENILRSQNFATVPENDLKVLRYLRENQKASEREIAESLKLPLNDVVDSVDNLTKGGLIKGQLGLEIKITTKGDGELADVPLLEVETRYIYAERPGVPPTKNSRDFCVNLLAEVAGGKTWSRNEIDSITNEFGEDAWKYRGGWYHNPVQDKTVPYCRHEWKQVIVRKK